MSGTDGVTIYIGVAGGTPGSPGATPASGTTSSGPACSSTPMNVGGGTRSWFQEEAPQHPDAIPWVVNCEGVFSGIVWAPVSGSPPNVVLGEPGPAIDPAVLAASLLERIPLPDITIGVNPARGLVALPSWFWVEGYDGTPISAAESLGGITVEVEISPTAYRWSFGDGETLETASAGRPYPEESDVRHVYERSWLAAGGEYQVELTITFAARYRVDGGPWLPLAPLTRSFTSSYPVQQLQAVLTGD